MRSRLPVLLVIAICLPFAAAPALAAQAGSVTIYWTASGDDGLIGRATTYDLRRSLAPITPANFNLATRITGLAAPQPVGSAESFTVTGLTAGTRYYFALKAVDEASNYSAISNVPFVTVGTLAVRNPFVLSLSPPWPNPARGEAHWSLALPEPGTVVMDAFDAAGRHVASITREWMPAGQNEINWDLKNRAGDRVAAGLYLVRATFGGQILTRRLVVTR